MDRFSFRKNFLAAMMLAVSMPVFAHNNTVKREYRPGELIVKFKGDNVKLGNTSNGRLKSSTVTAVDQVLKEIGANSAEKLMPLTGKANTGKTLKSYNGQDVEQKDMSSLYTLKYDTTKAADINTTIEKLQSLEDVEFAEPNYIVYAQAEESSYNDPLYSEQWGIPAIKLDQLWGKPKITKKRSVIAILDTGVDIDHPDLADNIWTNEKEADGEENVDDDGNGFKDDIHGWDFVNQTAKMRDNNGHGTHCAGIAAAVGNNGIGVVGANPDALIMPITVMQSDGTGDIATIIKGVDYAAANGADVISMSLGTYSQSLALEQSLGKAYATCVLVAAAGNDGHTIEKSNHCINCMLLGGLPMFPAAYTFVLGVVATNSNSGTIASYSNYDNNGPFESTYGEEKLYNYEVKAPGSNIMSTYPKGKYKSINGTSMACPLVAGAVSLLMNKKEITSKDILMADVIFSENGNIDLEKLYSLSDKDRLPSLYIIGFEIDDSQGDGDGRFDAGEIVDIYPIVRNVWGDAENVRLSMELANENEDRTIVTFLENNIELGRTLSTYGKAKSVNPIRLKIANECVDGRHIQFQINSICDNMFKSTPLNVNIIVENGVELGGIIEEDLTLYPNVHYIVTSNIAVPRDITVTIKPGVILNFKNNTGISNSGTIICNGTKDSMIIFQPANGINCNVNQLGIGGEYIHFKGLNNISLSRPLKNCIIENVKANPSNGNSLFYRGPYEKCNIINCTGGGSGLSYLSEYINCNLINNEQTTYSSGQLNTFISYNDTIIPDLTFWYSFSQNCNIMFNHLESHPDVGNICFDVNSPIICKSNKPSYLGTSIESTARKSAIDMYNPTFPKGYGKIDLSNMLTRPSREAHGIVWKVVVNGYDAQDEFDSIAALGPGKHKFEVYFNRPMDVSVAPNVTMGVRPPYTQTSIAEDGTWSADSMIYTAYLNITAKSDFDGLNRIYVYGARDNEKFECPDEKHRFNVMVQKAGSMSTGLEAIAGLGKVTLNWETDPEDFEDLLGYNVYRYTEEDTIPRKVNETLLEADATELVDFDVVPGTAYYYTVREMSTDLSQTSVSNVVVATPLSSIKGDANGSMKVDVADVVTEINYLTNQNPEPFIFEAADVNSDNEVNILDVVGTLNIILNPDGANTAGADNPAAYSVEDGILYVESVEPLAGVQVSFAAEEGAEITPMQALNSMERTGHWVSANEYMLLAYSMTGKTIATGKQAIAKIGDNKLKTIVLSDRKGHNIEAIESTENIENMIDELNKQGIANAEVHYYDLNGREINSFEAKNKVCVVAFFVDGKVVKSAKFMVK